MLLQLNTETQSDLIKVAMLDDEPDAIENLNNILENFVPNTEVVASFTNPTEAIKEIKNYDFDVLFLDVQMPKLNGFDVLQEIGTINFQVVFITAYERYALRAFRSNAVDYLLKPINTNDLKNTIAVLQKMKTTGLLDGALQYRYNNSLRNFFNSLKAGNTYQENITLKSDTNITIVPVHTIQRIISTKQGAVFHLSDQKQVLSGLTLTECEGILNPERFIRCHISHIVNKDFISEITTKRTGTAILKDGVTIPISARRKAQVLKQF